MEPATEITCKGGPLPATACARELMRRLGLAGSWLDRTELTDGMTQTAEQIDDELADMVMNGVAEFAERGRRYRLAGAPIARLALRQLLGGTDKLVVIGRATADMQTYRLGLARRVTASHGAAPADERIVMAAVEMPYPPEGPAEIARLAHLIDTTIERSVAA